MRRPIHYLASALQRSGKFASLKRFEGGALLVRSLNQEVALYLYENCPSAKNVGETLARNSAEGIYSLFVLRGAWFNETLPHFEGTLNMLRFVYPHNRVYAYQMVDDALWIVPVYDGGGYGMPVDLTDIHHRVIEIGRVRWGIAEFGVQSTWQPRSTDDPPRQQQQRRQRQRHYYNAEPAPYVAQVYYNVLGVRRDMSEGEIRRVYHQLAQRYHPDLNDSVEATQKMQMINEAYRQIMRK